MPCRVVLSGRDKFSRFLVIFGEIGEEVWITIARMREGQLKEVGDQEEEAKDRRRVVTEEGLLAVLES